MTTPAYPPKPSPGDRVAVISPSAGLPGILPLPYELGLERLRTEYGLEPVEYPATRRMGSTPQERADDIHAAFADPDVKAVMASIGGDDQITVLPLLDRELIRANPKPFFGYSDNTNLLAHLWNTGIVGYHGATVMGAGPSRRHGPADRRIRCGRRCSPRASTNCVRPSGGATSTATGRTRRPSSRNRRPGPAPDGPGSTPTGWWRAAVGAAVWRSSPGC
jgi:hypothetical protein